MLSLFEAVDSGSHDARSNGEATGDAGAAFVFGFAFVFITTAVNLLYADEAFTVQFLRYILSGFYLLLVIPLSIRNRDDLRDLA